MIAIIYHYTAGSSLDNTIRYFQGNPRNASAHYVIGHDGTVVQMVRLDRSAHHAGRSTLPGVRGSVNRYTVGIEVVNQGPLFVAGRTVLRRPAQPGGRPAIPYAGPPPVVVGNRLWEPYRDPQYESLLRLTRYLLGRFPAIRIITGHSDIALPRGRKADPGPAFDWARLRSGLRGIAGHIGPLPPPALAVPPPASTAPSSGYRSPRRRRARAAREVGTWEMAAAGIGH